MLLAARSSVHIPCVRILGLVSVRVERQPIGMDTVFNRPESFIKTPPGRASASRMDGLQPGVGRRTLKWRFALSEIKIGQGYVPGSLGRVAELHGVYYHEHWKFGLFFEAKVAVELSEFLKRYDENRDGFWIVSADGRVQGSIAIDGIHGYSKGAHLRWFIISDALRGNGAGNQLVNTAIHHCRSRGYSKIYLWTFEGLDAARHLYEKVGFKMVEEHKGNQWGTEVNEQRFECMLTSPA